MPRRGSADDVIVLVNIKGDSTDFRRASTSAQESIKALNTQVKSLVREQKAAARGIHNATDSLKGQGRAAYNLKQAEGSLTTQLRRTRDALRGEETAAKAATRGLNQKAEKSVESAKAQDKLTKAAQATTEKLKSEGRQAKQTGADLEAKGKASKGAAKDQEELAAAAGETEKALDEEGHAAERAAFWLKVKGTESGKTAKKQLELNAAAIRTQEALQNESHAAFMAALGIKTKGTESGKAARKQGELSVAARAADKALRSEAVGALLAASAISKANREVAHGKSHPRGILASNFRSQPVLAAMVAAAGVSFEPLIAGVTDAGLAVTELAGSIEPLIGMLGLVPSAVGTAAQALLVFKTTMKGVGTALQAPAGSKQEATAFEKLSGPAIKFVKEMKKDVVPELSKLRNQMQMGLFPGITKGAKEALGSIKPIRQALYDTSVTMGALVAQAGKMIGGKKFGADLLKIGESNREVIWDVGRATLFWASAFRHLMVAAGPVLEHMSQDFLEFSKNARDFFKEKRDDGSLTRFLDRAYNRTKLLGGVFIDFGRIVHGVFKAIAPITDRNTKSIADMVDHWADLVNGTKGQNSIRKYFREAQPAIHEAGRAIGATAKALIKMGGDGQGNLVKLLRGFRTDFIPAITTLAHGINKNLFPTVLKVLRAFLRLVHDVAPQLTSGLRPAVEAIGNTLTGLFNVVRAISGAFKHWPGILKLVPFAAMLIAFEMFKKRLHQMFQVPVYQKVIPEYQGGVPGGKGGKGGGMMPVPIGGPAPPGKSVLPVPGGGIKTEGMVPFGQKLDKMEGRVRRFGATMKGMARTIGPSLLIIQGLAAAGTKGGLGAKLNTFTGGIIGTDAERNAKSISQNFKYAIQQLRTGASRYKHMFQVTTADLRKLASGSIFGASRGTKQDFSVRTGINVAGFNHDEKVYVRKLAGLRVHLRDFNKRNKVGIGWDAHLSDRTLRNVENLFGLMKNASGEGMKEMKGVIARTMGAIKNEVGTKSATAQALLSKNMRIAVHSIGRSMADGVIKAGAGMKLIHTLLKKYSGAGAQDTHKNFMAMASSIRTAMNAGVISTAKGAKMIRAIFSEELRSYGFTKKEAAKLTKSGVSLTDVLHGKDLSKALGRGPQGLGSGGHASGGFVGRRGEKGRDAVPMRVPRGTPVLNADQQKALGFAGGGMVDVMVGRGEYLGTPDEVPALNARAQQRGYSGLNQVFAEHDRPHYLAKGGTAGGSKFTAMVREANAIDSRHYPYVWGGGHNSRFAGPFDCSGAVSSVLHAGGYLSSPMVSGSLAHWGAPGPGAVTIFANPKHTYMRIGGKYFGTTGQNPGGGAGWFNGAPRPGFAVRHVPGVNGKLGSMAGGNISVPKWQGRGGALGVLGKTVLAGLTKAANSRLSQVAAATMAGGNGFGGGDMGEFTGSGIALMKSISKKMGWNFRDWWGLDAGESSHGRNLANPHSTARLRGQFLSSNWGKYGIGSDPRRHPSMDEQIKSMARYIKQRYGNPSAAYSAWRHRSPHWYAGGGIAGDEQLRLPTHTPPSNTGRGPTGSPPKKPKKKPKKVVGNNPFHNNRIEYHTPDEWRLIRAKYKAAHPGGRKPKKPTKVVDPSSVRRPGEVPKGNKHANKPKWKPHLSAKTKRLIKKPLKVMAGRFKGKLKIDWANNTIKGLEGGDTKVGDLQQLISLSEQFRGLRNDELFPTVEGIDASTFKVADGDPVLNTKGLWLHRDPSGSYNPAGNSFVGGQLQHLSGGKFRPPGWGGEYSKYDTGLESDQSNYLKILDYYHNQVALINDAQYGQRLIKGPKGVTHGYMGGPNAPKGEVVRSHTGILKAISERKARLKSFWAHMTALARLRKNLHDSLVKERKKKGNWQDLAHSSKVNITHWQHYIDELQSKDGKKNTVAYKQAVRHARERISYWEGQKSYAERTHFPGGSGKYKTKLKRDIFDIEDDLFALGGNKVKASKGGGEYHKTDASLSNYRELYQALVEKKKNITGELIPGALASLIGVRQEIKEWKGALTPFKKPEADNADAIKDLQLEMQRGIIAQQSSALGQLDVFKSLAPLIAERYVGSFATGGMITKSGMALVHRGETVTSDPDGPFGAYRGRHATQVPSAPVEVTLVLKDRAGQLVELVDARIDKQAAKVVSNQLGRQTTRLRAARGGRG